LKTPIEMEWIARCFDVSGATIAEARHRKLHVSDTGLIDLEYSPVVGLYYVVDH